MQTPFPHAKNSLKYYLEWKYFTSGPIVAFEVVEKVKVKAGRNTWIIRNDWSMFYFFGY